MKCIKRGSSKKCVTMRQHGIDRVETFYEFLGLILFTKRVNEMFKTMMMGLVIGVALSSSNAVVAVDQEKIDPTGTWKWEVTRGEQKREQTLKLKLEKDKLTGVMIGRDDAETAIEEAKLEKDEISFKYTRERNGQKFTTSYKGKIDGEKIKGKINSERNGEKVETDWLASKAKA